MLLTLDSQVNKPPLISPRLLWNSSSHGCPLPRWWTPRRLPQLLAMFPFMLTSSSTSFPSPNLACAYIISPFQQREFSNLRMKMMRLVRSTFIVRDTVHLNVCNTNYTCKPLLPFAYLKVGHSILLRVSLSTIENTVFRLNYLKQLCWVLVGQTRALLKW